MFARRLKPHKRTVLVAAVAAGFCMSSQAQAYQVVRQVNQPESRDAAGRVTVDAAMIHVVACNGPGENGGQYYVYQYAKHPVFRAILPPNWAQPIGGRDWATLEQAAATACGRSAVGTTPPASPPQPATTRMCPFLAGPSLQQTRVLHMNTFGGAANYYFNPQHGVYCGYGAIHSSEFTGEYLKQEGNGFVGYQLVNGHLERRTFYHRERTETVPGGKVWDVGRWVSATDPQRTGDWRATWN